MTTRPDTPRLPRSHSLLGRIACDRVHAPRDNLLYVLVIIAALLVLAVKTWGLVAPTTVALAAVPACFALLILISVGKWRPRRSDRCRDPGPGGTVTANPEGP